MLHAVFWLYPQAIATSITLPIEMLNAADGIYRTRHRHEPAIQINLAALDYEPVIAAGGIALTPTITLRELGACDLIVLPALWRNPRAVIRSHSALMPWLRDRYAEQAIISAVGTGSCMLASSGLLDDRPATTHWHFFDQFEQDYPAVQLRKNHLITQAANLYCAGSVNSIADLMVHFIGLFYGQPIAAQVEGQFSPEIRQAYDKHLYSEGLNPSHPDEDIVRVQYWLQSHIDQTIHIRDLASLAGMSVRSLNRRFKKATQQTPLEYLQQLRINTAKDLLRDSNLSVTEICYKVGYSDGSHFAAVFKKLNLESPHNYRKKVRGKLFSSELGDSSV